MTKKDDTTVSKGGDGDAAALQVKADEAAAAAKVAADAAAAASKSAGTTGDQTPGNEPDKAAAALAAKKAADAAAQVAADAAAAADSDWEKRFKGLQPKHQKLVEDHKDATAQFLLDTAAWDAEKVKMGLQIDTLDSDLKKATEGLTGIEKTNTELQGVVDSNKAKLDRNKMIMETYPDLAVLEAKGLIREDIEGDELTKALDDMRSLMVAKGEAAVKDLGLGAGGDGDHSSGGRGEGMGSSDIGEKLMEAQKNRDHDEVNRLTALLIKTADAEIFPKE